jgi:FkbM family methyltransferase
MQLRFLRRVLFKLRNKLVSYVDIGEEEIFIELSNGLRFYGPREHEIFEVPPYLQFAAWELGLADERYISFICVLLEIFYFNIYEKFYRVKRGDVVIDAGAFVGMFTVKMAKIVGNKGKVIAIEPEKTNSLFLKKNVKENGLKNVIVIEKGLWSEKGKKSLYLGYRSSPSLVYPTKKSIEVEVDTLDNIVSELRLKDVNFIKIDVEGAEIEALKGAKRILNNNPNLVIAAYHEIGGEPAYRKIIPFLEAKNFAVNRTGGIVYARKII